MAINVEFGMDFHRKHVICLLAGSAIFIRGSSIDQILVPGVVGEVWNKSSCIITRNISLT